MKFFCVLLLIGVCNAHVVFQQEWEFWKQEHGKQYAVDEEAKRQYIWNNNLKYVTQHNLEADRGMHTYVLGMTKFADLDVDEWRSLMLSNIIQSPKSTSNMTHIINPNRKVFARTVNWTEHGYVTGVKDQGHCGSCWAFSATGSLEGQHFNKSKILTSLSEQNLVECSQAEGNHGCKGGLMDNAFMYIKKNGGIDTEASYPYTGNDTKPCSYKAANSGAKLSSWIDVESESEMSLMDAVESVGPISVAIDAGHKSFQLYKAGIYYEPVCSSTKLDHGVLAVGFSSEDSGAEYWIVKNSWSVKWGMEGYIWMSRNRNNNCGIATKASYPVV